MVKARDGGVKLRLGLTECILLNFMNYYAWVVTFIKIIIIIMITFNKIKGVF